MPSRFETLRFEDGWFDFALLVTTVCFLEAPEVAFKEAYRALKADGLIIVGLIDKDSNLGKKYEARKSENKFYKNAHFHSVGEIRENLEAARFSHIEGEAGLWGRFVCCIAGTEA